MNWFESPIIIIDTGFCVLVLSFYKKESNTILLYQIVANFAYTIHYFLLGALSGAFISFIGIFRNIGFLKLKNNKLIFAIIIFILYLLVTLVFYENIYSLFPIIANSTYLFLMIKASRKKLIIGGIFGSILWMIYAICVNSYSGMITEFILIVSNSVQLIKLKKSR